MGTLMDFDYLVKKVCIDLSFNGLHDDILDVLVEVMEKSEVLKELNLYSNHIAFTDEKFTNALAANKTIEVLSLGSNQIDGEGGRRLAAAVRRNRSLRELHLGSNHIGDAGGIEFAAALRHNKSILMLSLYENGIGDAGAKSLAAAFKVNHTLRTLWLHENGITDDGARSMAQGLRGNCAIEKLFLLGNRISAPVENSIQHIVADLKTRKKQLDKMIIAQREEEIAAKNEDIARKDEELASKDAQIAHLRDILETKDRELVAKDVEIAQLMARLATLNNPEVTPTEGLKADAGEVTFEDDRDDVHAGEDHLTLETVATE